MVKIYVSEKFRIGWRKGRESARIWVKINIHMNVYIKKKQINYSLTPFYEQNEVLHFFILKLINVI